MTTACQVPLLVGFPRQEYGAGLPFPSPTGKRREAKYPPGPKKAKFIYSLTQLVFAGKMAHAMGPRKGEARPATEVGSVCQWTVP